MTFQVLILAYRLPSISPSDFKAHYEGTHIPLIQSLTGDIFPISHTRKYIQHSSILVGTPEDFPYDAYAELVFEDAAHFQKFFAKVTEPEIAKVIAEDEKNFLQEGKMRAVVIGDNSITKRVW